MAGDAETRSLLKELEALLDNREDFLEKQASDLRALGLAVPKASFKSSKPIKTSSTRKSEVKKDKKSPSKVSAGGKVLAKIKKEKKSPSEDNKGKKSPSKDKNGPSKTQKKPSNPFKPNKSFWKALRKAEASHNGNFPPGSRKVLCQASKELYGKLYSEYRPRSIEAPESKSCGKGVELEEPNAGAEEELGTDSGLGDLEVPEGGLGDLGGGDEDAGGDAFGNMTFDKDAFGGSTEEKSEEQSGTGTGIDGGLGDLEVPEGGLGDLGGGDEDAGGDAFGNMTFDKDTSGDAIDGDKKDGDEHQGSNGEELDFGSGEFSFDIGGNDEQNDFNAAADDTVEAKTQADGEAMKDAPMLDEDDTLPETSGVTDDENEAKDDRNTAGLTVATTPERQADDGAAGKAEQSPLAKTLTKIVTPGKSSS